MNTQSDSDKLLFDSVKLINTTIEPVRITPESNGYSLITTKSYNSEKHPHKILLQHIDQLIREESIGQMRCNFDETCIPKFDQALYDANQLDYNFDVHYNNASYDFSNLEFNLNPRRSTSYGKTVLELVDKFSSVDYQQEFIKNIHIALDKPCQNGDNCAFRQYFYPQLDLVGLTAYSIGIEELFTSVPISISSEAFYQTWLETLNIVFGLDETNPCPKFPEVDFCVCCLLVQQSKTSLEGTMGTSILGVPNTTDPLKHIRILGVNGTENGSQNLFSDYVHVGGHFSKHIHQYPFSNWEVIKIGNDEYEVIKKDNKSVNSTI